MKVKFFAIVCCIMIAFACIIGISKVKADSGFDSSYGSGGFSYSSGSGYGSGYGSASGSLPIPSDLYYDDSPIYIKIICWVVYIAVIASIIPLGIVIGKCYMRKKTKSKLKKINKEIDKKIEELMLDINKQEFLDKAYDIYIAVQNAWMNFELPKVRNLLTDELYNMYVSQLKTLEIKGEKNIMDGFELLEICICNIEKINNTIEITVEMDIKQRDYIINSSTNEVLRGTDKSKFEVVYGLTFVKSVIDDKIKFCPSCGSSIDINTSTVCKYCGNTIVSVNNNDWVLSRKRVVSQ